MKPPEGSEYHLAAPTGRGPGVLVLPSWWGLNDGFKDRCARLADEGFVALGVDLLQGKLASTIEEAQQFRRLPRKEPVYKSLLRAINHLQAHPKTAGDQIGVMGCSIGAHWAFWLAAQPDLPIQATVTFYGVRAGSFRQSHSSFLCHFAEHDPWVSVGAQQRLKKRLEQSGRTFEFHTYPGTEHWFFEPQPSHTYNPQAAQLSWQRTLAFFRENLRFS
jgi:carboxymethylenebutenolidase